MPAPADDTRLNDFVNLLTGYFVEMAARGFTRRRAWELYENSGSWHGATPAQRVRELSRLAAQGKFSPDAEYA